MKAKFINEQTASPEFLDYVENNLIDVVMSVKGPDAYDTNLTAFMNMRKEEIGDYENMGMSPKDAAKQLWIDWEDQILDSGSLSGDGNLESGFMSEGVSLADMYREMGTWFKLDQSILSKMEKSGIDSDNNPVLGELVNDWSSGMYDEDPNYIFNELEDLVGNISEEGDEHPLQNWREEEADRRWERDEDSMYDPEEEPYDEMDEEWSGPSQGAIDDSHRRSKAKERRWNQYEKKLNKGTEDNKRDYRDRVGIPDLDNMEEWEKDEMFPGKK